MELNFDKEMDALIRREAAGRTITISERAGLHLDADEIAAFAEGAVPPAARSAFVLHFAECDPCRETLANTIAINAEEVPEAAAGLAAPVQAADVPWYRRLFLFPNLAYVMGGLVVLFAGFIGLSVLTGTYSSGESEVSRISSADQDAPASEAPAIFESTSNTNAAAASSSANTASNAMNAAANAANTTVVPPADFASNRVARQVAEPSAELPATQPQPMATPAPVRSKDNRFATDAAPADRDQEQRVTAAAPPPKAVKEENRTAVAGESLSSNTAAKQKAPARNEPGSTLRPMSDDTRKAPSTPSGAGTTATARRTVGGRTFEFRRGAWYETTYRGQGTINVRRETDAYRKLDGGLRGIAESFIGAVVVTVWNGKAYRIQ